MFIYVQPSYKEQLLDPKWEKKRSIIINRDHHKCQICGNHGNKNNPIVVHHRYYQFGVLAWEYNNDVLITLCAKCHSLIHQTISLLCYYNNGGRLLLMNFTPCHRCNGAGWFSEYKHVQDGICFRCEGQRYEELIQKKEKEINFDDYCISDKDSFDLLNPSDNITEIIEICKKGEDYYWANNGVDIDKAYSFLRKAALNGYGVAQNYCGLILYKQKDYRRSLRWFVYSALQGTPQAQYNLYTIFSSRIEGINENIDLANKWLNLSKAKIEDLSIPDVGTIDFEDYMKTIDYDLREDLWLYESQETINSWTLKEFLLHCGATKAVKIFEVSDYHALTEGGEDTIAFYVGKKCVHIFNFYNHYPIKYVAENPDEFWIEQQKSGYYYIRKKNDSS